MSTMEAPVAAPTASGVADLPEVLSREQAAWMLQISPRVLDEAAKHDRIPSRKIGRRRVFSKTALLAFVGATS